MQKVQAQLALEADLSGCGWLSPSVLFSITFMQSIDWLKKITHTLRKYHVKIETRSKQKKNFKHPMMRFNQPYVLPKSEIWAKHLSLEILHVISLQFLSPSLFHSTSAPSPTKKTPTHPLFGKNTYLDSIYTVARSKCHQCQSWQASTPPKHD